jgi:hypothetical protein
MSKHIKFWIQLNEDKQYSNRKDSQFEFGVKYPVLEIDFPTNRMLVVIKSGLMKYTTSDAFVISDGIRPIDINEIVEKEEFVKLTKLEYQNLSKEEKEAYSLAKKEWESQ